jgi:hypothetical protein
MLLSGPYSGARDEFFDAMNGGGHSDQGEGLVGTRTIV